MIFDTHAHYDNGAFNPDRDAVLSALPGAGIVGVVNPGCSMESSRRALELGAKWDFVHPAVGVHPEDAQEITPDALAELRTMAQTPGVVAIGEIGLDYHYKDGPPRDVQAYAFRSQLELARELDKPVIVHQRDACADCMDIVRDFRDMPGVFHCFSGSWETAKQLLDWGWYLSFTGVITFKNAQKSVEIVKKMPIDRLMLETDCPYMAPEPFRGKRCTSALLQYTAAGAAAARGMDEDELCAVTTENARKFFRLF